jgi:hypothetical protein
MSPLAWALIFGLVCFCLGYYTGHQLAKGGPWVR